MNRLQLAFTRALPLAGVAIMVTLAAGCHSGPASTSTPAPASTSTVAAAAPAGGDDAFCALVKQKGGEDALAMDSSGGDIQPLLDNLDAMTAAAPGDIKPDFQTLDKLEHTIFGSGTMDPSALAHLQDPDVAQSLAHIRDYLSGQCHISG